jgi:hypothetical protein
MQIKRKFGRLTFIANAGRGKHSHALARVRCFCETKCIVRWERLRREVIKSCGCLSTKFKPGHKPPMYRHGQSAKGGSPEYRNWTLMNQRCLNPRNQHFKYYGGAKTPVTICRRWRGPRGFDAFLADVGKRPANTTLGGLLDSAVPEYCPENCEWMTRAEQGAERRGKNAAKLLHDFHTRQRRKAA